MNFEHTDKVKDLIAQIEAFMDEHIYPNEQRPITSSSHDPANLWKEWPGMEPLKEKARAEGLWNLFLPHEYGAFSPGLTNLEYAPLAEIMGRVPWSSRCSTAPRPTPATWKCWPSTARPSSRKSG
jgi:acyl-CoA dehydrogenase